METLLNTTYHPFPVGGSYPTYEEWKLGIIVYDNNGAEFCSYPTYEEWKQISLLDKYCKNTCSYPTYEEWKLLSQK